MDNNEIIDLIKSNYRGGAFDIDDTITKTSAAFYDLLNERWPAPEEVTVEAMAKHYSLHGRTLYWGEKEEAEDLIIEAINSDNFHSRFAPITGSKEGLKRLNELEITACYWTARLRGMHQKTEEWFKVRSYPNLPIIMCPSEIPEGRSYWKAEVLIKLYPEVSFAVDNDVRVANHLQEMDYPGKLYLFGLDEEDFPVSEIVQPTKNWEELVERILKDNK